MFAGLSLSFLHDKLSPKQNYLTEFIIQSKAFSVFPPVLNGRQRLKVGDAIISYGGNRILTESNWLLSAQQMAASEINDDFEKFTARSTNWTIKKITELLSNAFEKKQSNVEHL